VTNPQRPQDLEQLLFNLAEHKKEEDYQLLFQLMAAAEVFVPADLKSMPANAKPGQPYKTQPGDNVAVKTVQVPGLGSCVAGSTTQSSPLVAGGYVGMTWLGLLEMALKIEACRGVLLQGQTSWIALDRQRVEYALSLTKTK
jgi:hypothetical protein